MIRWLDDWQAALLLYCSVLLSDTAQILLPGKTEHVSSSSLFLLTELPSLPPLGNGIIQQRQGVHPVSFLFKFILVFSSGEWEEMKMSER